MGKRASRVRPVKTDGAGRVRSDGSSSKSDGNSRGASNTTASNPAVPDSPTQNLMLAKLPPAELELFDEYAERATFKIRDVLLEAGEPIENVFFPASAMISLVTVLSNGTSIEAMTVGYEGVAGLAVFHGVKTVQSRAVCQIPGDAYCLSASSFMSLVEKSPLLQGMMHKYSQFMQDSMAQSAACNGIHLLEQRCARWLLLSSDAVRNRQFSLTQEFFAQMLAVRRSGVTTTMGALERQNLITTRYGSITIVDRTGLEEIACECYDTISKRRSELLA
jgi:CRP-like cAMP-binding protein